MNSRLRAAYPWQSPPHKKESNVGRSPSEILLEFMSTLLMSELALLCKKLLPATSQDSDHPREGASFASARDHSDHLLQPLHLVTLREMREREFLGIRGAPRHCAGTVQSGRSGSRALPSR